MALTDKSSIVIPKGFYGKANVLQGFNPQTENLVDLDVVRNTTATRVNEAGLIESVAANVPRRDFLNGGCGELLVEPQRTNLLTYSEQFDNADWLKTAATIAANSITAPDGTLTADKIVEATVNDYHKVTQSSLQNIDRPISIFAKAGERNLLIISALLSGNPNKRSVIYDLSEGNIVYDPTGYNSEITHVGDGWYRCTTTATSAAESTSTNITFGIGVDASLPANNDYTGDGTSGIYIWGAQFEEGTYPTSYIPTTASAVTRNQDVISASNIGSLLNDAEGGIFVEAAPFEVSSDLRFALSDGSINNRVSISYFSSPQYFVVVDGAVIVGAATSATATANVFSKITLRYATNDFAVYQNGNSFFTQNTGATFNDGTLTDVRFSGGESLSPFFGRIRNLIVFNNAPTDSELQTLTTP